MPHNKPRSCQPQALPFEVGKPTGTLIIHFGTFHLTGPSAGRTPRHTASHPEVPTHGYYPGQTFQPGCPRLLADVRRPAGGYPARQPVVQVVGSRYRDTERLYHDHEHGDRKPGLAVHHDGVEHGPRPGAMGDYGLHDRRRRRHSDRGLAGQRTGKPQSPAAEPAGLCRRLRALRPGVERPCPDRLSGLAGAGQRGCATNGDDVRDPGLSATAARFGRWPLRPWRILRSDHRVRCWGDT